MSQYTPMIEQYLEIKEQHQDAILFFRLGDFYEMFSRMPKQRPGNWKLFSPRAMAGRMNAFPCAGSLIMRLTAI